MITFGRFGHVEDRKKEKEIFLEQLNLLMKKLTFYEDNKEYKETEIIKPLKAIILKIKENSYFNSLFRDALYYFLRIMGFSYYNLTQKEMEEIIDMDFTYENWEKKSLYLINNFIERIKKASPPLVWFCFDDIYFVFHIQLCSEKQFKLNDLVTYIRGYFILNDTAPNLKEYRNPEIFNEIQKKVFDLYPIIKERIGMNRTLEKILSYIRIDTDYNYEITKNILNNYYNKNNKIKDEESIKLKDKQE